MLIRSAICLFTLLVLSWSCHARLPSQAPYLSPPDPNHYQIIEVSSAQALIDALWNLQSRQAVMIQPGVYNLASVDFPNGVDGRLSVGRFGRPMINDVLIRGATNNPADVIIHGAGMSNAIVPHGFQIATAEEVTIANLSIGEVYFHAIDIQGPQGANNILIYNVHAFDAGQQIIKGNTAAASDVRIEYSAVYYNGDGAIVHPATGTCYTNGIDTTGGDRWIIRDSHIHNIRCQNGALAGPAILLWRGASNSLVERNLLTDSSRGIYLGLQASHNGGPDHVGGIVRNNVITWDADAGYSVDTGIYTTSLGAAILHNTVLIRGHYQNAIEVRFDSASSVDVNGNATDAAIRARNGGSPTLLGNQQEVEEQWFVDAPGGDLTPRQDASALVSAIATDHRASDDFHARLRRAPPGLTEIGAVSLPALFADRFEQY